MRHALQTVFLASLLAATPALAESYPPAIEYLVSKGNRIVPLPDVHGLKGYLAINGNDAQPVYVTPDGQGLIAGILFDAQGRELTSLQLKAVKDAVTPQGNALKAKIAEDSYSFVMGTGGPEVIVFADPLCSACHKLWSRSARYIAAGKLRFRVVPVGINKASRETAASLVASGEPGYAWTAFTAHHLNERNPAYPTPKASSEALGVIDTNNKLFADLQLSVTPTIITFDSQDNPTVLNGVPEDIGDLLTP